MIGKLIRSDIRNNRFLSIAVCLFMAVCVMLFGVTVFLFAGLSSSVAGIMETAKTPDFLQMHTGEMDRSALETFAQGDGAVEAWQVSTFLNLENGSLTLNGESLADSTQDNGVCVQSEQFDFLLSMENTLPKVQPGEVYVPVCYMQQYDLSTGETMEIGDRKFTIGGFLRDSQMNAMMASSKRFLVHEADYEALASIGQEEYLIEFRLKEGEDPDSFAQRYEAAGLPNNGPAITYPLIRMMNTLSDGLMILILGLIAVAALVISLLCVRFILLAGMEKDRQEIGMLKAIGIENRRIRFLYFAKFLALAGTGLVLGLLGAFLLQKPLFRQIQELYGRPENMAGMYLWAVVSALAVLGVQLFSLWRLLKRTEKLSAVKCLQGIPEEKQKGTRKQYVFIGSVAAVSLFLMLLPQNLYSTISSTKFVGYMGIGEGQLRLDVRQTQDILEKTQGIRKDLGEDGSVVRFVSLQTVSCPIRTLDGGSGSLTLELGDHTVFPVQYASGHAPQAEGELALSVLNAQQWNLGLGDMVTLKAGEVWKLYVVCGIYSDITNGGKTAKAFSLPGEHEIMWSVFYITLQEGVPEEEWIARYQSAWEDQGGGGIKLISIGEYVRGTYGQTISQIRQAAMLAFLVAAVILWLVTVLFLRLVIQQQRYEISLRKALGFSSREIEKLYGKKSMAAIFLGAAGGLLLGLPVGNLVAKAILTNMGAAGFSFLLNGKMVFLVLPGAVLLIGLLAVKTGSGAIRKIRAFECCMGERNG